MDPGQWFKDIIDRLLNNVVWPVFIGASVIMFIWAGFLFLSASGDPGKITTAKKAAVFGAIGIAIGLLGSSVVPTVKNLLGL